jgi:peptide/nickel transport system substrate-binding protein
VKRLALCIGLALLLVSCAQRPDPQTLVIIIESSPANLDPRVGTDAQSERIDQLLFDGLLTRDERFELRPGLAEHWEVPDPVTYIFYLHRGVRFHDGRPLTARDVKWTFDSMMDGTVITAKASTFRFVQRIETPDDATVIFHMKEPYATLPWNVSSGAIGIVPYGSGRDFGRAPVGSGPFRFVRQQADSEVILERNPDYWREKANLVRVRFAVVPDATTRALELRKGSADIAINALPADTVAELRREGQLAVEQSPGTIYAYLAFNLRDPILKDVRVRQALACAIDRRPLLEYLWRGMARPASSVLPPEHWAFDSELTPQPYDPKQAMRILDDAGYHPGPDGIRLRLTMKTSTEESSRLMAAVLQQQLRQVGIALDIRTYEFGTFYSDVVHGSFQMYSLRWIGGNEDPDIFEHVFHSASFPPKRANRSYYSNPRVDALIDQARRETDEAKRKPLYAEVQRIVAQELPYINLWYFDNVLVHSRRVDGLKLAPSGNYDFLKTAELAQ